MNPELMARAVALAVENVRAGGGPFAALVVRGGEVVGEGTNRVTALNDPTAHAEVVAIRDACARLGTFQLGGCDLYTTCEPCPMCLGAVYWARPDRVFFAATRFDAAAAGFDDALIYREVAAAPADRLIPTVHAAPSNALAPFDAWRAQEAKVEY